MGKDRRSRRSRLRESPLEAERKGLRGTSFSGRRGGEDALEEKALRPNGREETPVFSRERDVRCLCLFAGRVRREGTRAAEKGTLCNFKLQRRTGQAQHLPKL